MAVYTAAQIKELSSLAKVSTLSDDRILLYQAAAESILNSMNLDSNMPGYQAAYNTAIIFIFDHIAENPTGLKTLSEGKVAKSFGVDLPSVVVNLIKPFIQGQQGQLQGARLRRKDIGLR